MIKYLIFFLMFIIWALFVVMRIDINRFVVREYTIYSDKLKDKIDLVLLADMHNKEFGTDNYKLIKAIKDMDPDIICCAGDMLTARRGSGEDNALKLFSYLKDYPVYYGIGNHEYRKKIYPEDFGDEYDRYIAALKEMGVNVLENDRIKIDGSGVIVQGIMIDRKFYKRTGRNKMTTDDVTALTGSMGPEYTILLAHNPEYFDEYAGAGADLVLSGHVHGGLMRLPYLGGVISPNLRFFPKYDGGIFTYGNSQMVLSRGLGYHTLPIRLFNPGELIHIRLLPCKV